MKRLLSGFTGKSRWFLLSAAVLVLDQWTKWMIEIHLPHHASHPVIPGLFNLTHVRNTGVAFGMFATPGGEASWMLSALGLVALTLVLAYFAATPRDHRLLLLSLALVLGGAVGNLLDRMVSGAVTDFLDVYVGTHHWPSFNVADSAITIGIALMAIDAFRSHSRDDATEPRTTS